MNNDFAKRMVNTISTSMNMLERDMYQVYGVTKGVEDLDKLYEELNSVRSYFNDKLILNKGTLNRKG